MSWSVARSAIDLLANGKHKAPELRFYGGEPTLEPDFIWRAAQYLCEISPPGTTPRFHLTTNGTLIDQAMLRCFVGFRFKVTLSSDGVPAAQDHRSRSSFYVIDEFLRAVQKEYPAYSRNHLGVQTTLTSGNLPFLAESVRYFLGIGLGQVKISPIVTHDPNWKASMIADLRQQMLRVVDLSVDHYRRTSTVPVTFLRRQPCQPSRSAKWFPVCETGSERSIVVDVDGSAYPCRAFMPTARFSQSELCRPALDIARLGFIHAPEFAERLSTCRDRIRHIAMIRQRAKKHSSYGNCVDCAALPGCTICPMSIGAIPGNRDPDRVPDLPCAFHRVRNEAATLFWNIENDAAC